MEYDTLNLFVLLFYIHLKTCRTKIERDMATYWVFLSFLVTEHKIKFPVLANIERFRPPVYILQ